MATITTNDASGALPSAAPQKPDADSDVKPRLASSAPILRPTSHRGRLSSPNPTNVVRRRSSLLSLSSLDEAAQSFTDDIINPRTHRSKLRRDGEDEVTHWHSTPLVFAILPAVAGLLFKNGSVFVTDVLLLALAAVFLNWSVRLPWDWYYASQSTIEAVTLAFDDDTIAEEDVEAEVAVDIESSIGDFPDKSTTDQNKADRLKSSDSVDLGERDQAARDLRRQELLALSATFLFPCLAAYLLHVIRAQLSRPSTGLVSDYNLSIFILAAEIRPFRQLCRLIANRTLHLKRIATAIDEQSPDQNSTIAILMQRVNDLETRIADHTQGPASAQLAQKTDVNELQSELKKRYEPRLEGLERAVRRYEKRSTTFTMAIDQRLLALEGRTNDAFSLAAVAAQNSRSHSIFDLMVDLGTSAVVLPIKIVWSACKLPLNMAEEAYIRLKVLMLGPAYAPSNHGTKRSSGYNSLTPVRNVERDEKARLKYSGRKVPRDALR